MTRSKYLASVVAVAMSASVCSASINVIGTSVTGSLKFTSTPLNYFDPANGFVAPGFLNTASATVIMGEPAVEFGFDDGSNRDTANFTSNQLIVTDTRSLGTPSHWTMTFTDTAFSSLTIAKISDTFSNGGVSGNLVGNTITLQWPGGTSADGFMAVKFAIAPEPTSLVLLCLGAIGLLGIAYSRRGEKASGTDCRFGARHFSVVAARFRFQNSAIAGA